MIRSGLVVGINRYPYFQNLQYAARDAEEIARLLRKHGNFEVTLLPEIYQNGANQVEEKGTVKGKSLREEISQLFNPGDDCPETALLFFAGHGLQQPLPRNKFKGYLAPSDVDPSREKWGIPFDWLFEELIDSPVRNQIVWLDCCHSGEFTNLTFDQANPQNRGRENVNRSFIAACRKFEEAIGVEGHGLLTSLLLRGLSVEQNPPGKWINSKNLDAFINDELRNDPKLSTFRQRFRTNTAGEPINFWPTLGAVEQQTAIAVTPSQAKEKRLFGIEAIRPVPVWVGRDELLQQLKDQLLTPDSTLKMLVLVGQGGIGKSSLGTKLLEALGAKFTTETLTADSPYHCALCFKAQTGSSFDEVAGLLLRWLQIEVNETIKDATQKINLILTGLRKHRCIFFLDNLEDILHPASHPQAGQAQAPECDQLISLGKDKPGYLRKHPELVTRKIEPILREQLSRQSEAARDLLRRMCVLRVGIDIRGLTFLRLYTDDWEKDDRFEMAGILEEPAEFTEIEIRETQLILKGLLDSSLVQSRYDEQQGEDFYDLHRVIVEFLQKEYQAELPKLMESIYKFYSSGKNVENPQNLADLQPILEAQYFAFQLGNYSEASSLVMGKLEEYLRPWGHWNLLKDLYEQILPKVDDDDRPICLRQIGRVYRDAGNWDLAEKYFQDALAIEQEKENKSGMATSWDMLGDIELKRGNWDAAERLYRQSLELRTELGDWQGIAISIGCLGENELRKGNLDKAEKLLKEALVKVQELGMTWHIAEANYDLAQLERRRGNPELAQQHYDTAHQIFQQLGAAKELERIEQEWAIPDEIK